MKGLRAGVRVIIPAIGLGLATGAIAEPKRDGHSGPSFDCTRASAPEEKAICDDETLSWLDYQISQLYLRALDEAGDDARLAKIKDEQKLWLSEVRNACGGDISCQYEAHGDRLTDISNWVSGSSLTGTYDYIQPGGGGSLWLAHELGNRLSGKIETVSGPTFHICTLNFEGAVPVGGQYISSMTDEDFGSCTIALSPGNYWLEVSSHGCRAYCGARGYFDGIYSRKPGAIRR